MVQTLYATNDAEMWQGAYHQISTDSLVVGALPHFGIVGCIERLLHCSGQVICCKLLEHSV